MVAKAAVTIRHIYVHQHDLGCLCSLCDEGQKYRQRIYKVCEAAPCSTHMHARATHTHTQGRGVPFCLSLSDGISIIFLFIAPPHLFLLQTCIYKKGLCLGFICLLICLSCDMLRIELKTKTPARQVL